MSSFNLQYLNYFYFNGFAIVTINKKISNRVEKIGRGAVLRIFIENTRDGG
jgi:hypothetical protein